MHRHTDVVTYPTDHNTHASATAGVGNYNVDIFGVISCTGRERKDLLMEVDLISSLSTF